MNLCPVCASTAVTGFLNRSRIPVHQNLVFSTQQAARDITRGELDLVFCEACGFVYNRAFDPGRLSYGEDYDNTQSCSPFFDAYLDDLAGYLVREQGVKDSLIVEVGCGKGHFLRKLVSYPGAGNRGVGFDPSYVGPDCDLDGALSFQRRFYGPDCAELRADVVVCRHVIEHVPQPIELLRSIRRALEGSPAARVFFETPCVEWILDNRVVWDFFYEHCSLFSPASLTTALERAGFSVAEVRHVFGGQYLWVEAAPAGEVPVSLQPGSIAAAARAFSDSEAELVAVWRGRIEALAGQGRVALWGAGAKGSTLANLVDPECTLLDCVVDLNPNKQGKFLPGTGHPIVDYRDLAGRSVQNAILMNPNYREENERLLASSGIKVNLIDWS